MIFCLEAFKAPRLDRFSFYAAKLDIFSELCKKFGGYF